MASKAAATSRAQRPYEWQALAGDDVRILTLLPGRFDDELRIQIAHTQLPTAATSTGTRMTRKDLEGTLPSGWTVYESLDGRYLFVEWLDKTEQTLQSCSWTHPDPDIDSSLYEPAVYEAPGPQNHAFEALSYVWGSEDDPGLAFVQTSAGISTRTISIGRNLESALRHLRYGDKPRKLWVDAICINQTDDDEKSVQVRRMSRIYQSAYRVVAWIGPKADGSDVAMSTLEYLGFQVVAALDGMGFGSPDAQEEDWQMPTTELPYSRKVWDALYHLLDREWFERRWVVQEIILGNRMAIVRCGRREIPWSCFRLAVQCLRGKASLPERMRNALAYVDPLTVTLSCHASTVPRLLVNYQSRLCSNPVDSVYALLGIMPSKFASRVEVDYSASQVDVFKDVFLAHVGHVQRWELFGCGLKHRRCGGPSWVSDIATPTIHGAESSSFSSGYSRICVTFPNSDALEITGVKCATVVTATSAVSGRTLDQVRLVRSWEPPNMETATYV